MASPTRSRVRRLSVLVAALASTAAVLASGAQPATGADPRPAVTDVTLTWDDPAITVKVTSPRASCKDNRHAFIAYHIDRNPSLGVHGRTSPNGIFSFPSGGTPPADGNLISYVGKTRSTCRPGQSNLVPLEAPARADDRARTYAKLTSDGSTIITIKLTSPKASCTKGRRIDLFTYVGRDPIAGALTGRTNNRGIFTFTEDDARRSAGAAGIASLRITSFARQSPACAVGQSNTVTVPLS